MHAIPEISEQWGRWVSAIVACFVFVSRFLCIHFCSRAINCDVHAECANSFSKSRRRSRSRGQDLFVGAIIKFKITPLDFPNRTRNIILKAWESGTSENKCNRYLVIKIHLYQIRIT